MILDLFLPVCKLVTEIPDEKVLTISRIHQALLPPFEGENRVGLDGDLLPQLSFQDGFRHVDRRRVATVFSNFSSSSTVSVVATAIHLQNPQHYTTTRTPQSQGRERITRTG